MEPHPPVGAYGYMSETRPNRIAELRQAKGWTQAQLAEAVDVHWITISRLERGKIQLNEKWLDRLGKAFGIEPHEILKIEIREKTIYISGELRQNANAIFFNDYIEHDIHSSTTDDAVSSWFRVADDTLWPHYHRGDFIRFIAISEQEWQPFQGRLCLVTEIDSVQSHFGFLENYQADQVVRLRPLAGGPTKSVPVDSIRVAAEARYSMPWDGKWLYDSK